MENIDKKVRVQFSILELRWLRNLLVNKYHGDRHNLRYYRNRVALGDPDSAVYGIARREKHLKILKRLLKKVSKHTDIKWSER